MCCPQNEAQKLLRHCTEHQPNYERFRKNAPLWEALETLAAAAVSPEQKSHESSETIDPQLLDAAMALFHGKMSAVDSLSIPLRALGRKRLGAYPSKKP